MTILKSKILPLSAVLFSVVFLLNSAWGQESQTFKIFGAGNGAFRWELETEEGRRSLTGDDAAPLEVEPGDTIEWHTGTGFHGVVFSGLSESDFDSMFEELSGGGTLVDAPNGRTGIGVAGMGPGNPLLSVKVKDGATGDLDFQCSIHFPTMEGAIQLRTEPRTPQTFKIFGAGNGPFIWELETEDGRRSLTEDGVDPAMVRAGDTIEWHTGTGFHGVVFENTRDEFDALFDEQPGGGSVVDTPNGRPGIGVAGIGPDNLLLRVKVKAVPASTVGFRCSIHFPAMNGEVAIASAPTPTTFKIFGAGMGPFRWELETKDGRQDLSRANSSPVNVKPGDTVEWHSGTGFHGVVFGDASQAEFEQSFEVVDGLTLLANPSGQAGWGTNGVGPNSLILSVKIKEQVADLIQFHCSIHGPSMNGTIVESGTVESVVQGMSINVQRRMLRFVNQARSIEELTKSPQQRRSKFEHGPSAASPNFDRRYERVSAYDEATAKTMLDNRPLNGYSDVRSCLNLYGSQDGSGLPELLDSLGPKQFGEWRTVGEVRERDDDGSPKEEEPVMHAAMLHNGKVLLIPNNERTVLWDPNAPANQSIEIIEGAVSGLTANLFCSGHSFLPDGRLLVVGGGGGGPGEPSSIQGWKFDPNNNKWSRTANDMSFRRWYPTLVTLPDQPGKIMVAGGMTDPFGALSGFMDVYSESTDRFEPITASAPVGELTFPPTYPGLHLLPNGGIFHVPVGFGDCTQTASGAPSDPTALFSFSDPLKTAGSWETFQSNHRRKGMSALLLDTTSPFVQGIVIGGGDDGTSGTGQTINLDNRSLAWNPAFPLMEKRVHPNIVLLPDGTVFICGGMEASNQPPPNGGRCELYDPRTGSLTEMDELDRPRHYRSVAILLPSGEVMCTGGAGQGGCDVSRHNTIEVFSPPYLFCGDRPVIDSVRSEVAYGAAFEIDTPDPASISKVILARPMAVTHQNDSEQRMVNLSFTVSGPRVIEAVAPTGTPNSIAPPGWYMLFILNHDGVPSVAKWIQVQ